MRIERVEFTRTKGGEPELGLLINEGDGPLLDAKGVAVTEGGCWDYRRTNDFIVELDMREEKK